MYLFNHSRSLLETMYFEINVKRNIIAKISAFPESFYSRYLCIMR